MEETTKTNKKDETMSLFQRETIEHDRNETIKVIYDQNEKQTYTKEEILNSVILGDALKVKKMPEEIFDMVFVGPPYFLQLPKKELRRWTVKTVVEGVDDDWDKFPSFEEYDKFIQNLLIEVKRGLTEYDHEGEKIEYGQELIYYIRRNWS